MSGCQVNVTPLDEELSCSTVGMRYRACGRPTVVDIEDRAGRITAMCERHAAEHLPPTDEDE